MSDIKRRKVLALLGATPAMAWAWTPSDASAAVAHAEMQKAAAAKAPAKAKGPFKPKFFTAAEYATVVMLSDLIIPKDERSGGATEAGVPEFIDFTMADTLSDQPDRLVAMRGGLAWLDLESLSRFNVSFVKASATQRTQLLDDIAWPKKAKPEMSHGVRFFNMFRDMVATGFWTSKMGVEDLKYIGNMPMGEWNGSPAEWMQKVGVSYDE